MNFWTKNISLTDEGITEAKLELVEVYAGKAGRRACDLNRLELACEELLISCRESWGEGALCQIVGNKFLDHIGFRIRHEGESSNPILARDELGISAVILEKFGARASYNYDTKRELNIVSFEAPLRPVKNAMIKQILAAIILAVICAVAIHFLPTAVGQTITEGIIGPLFDKCTRIIAEIATPFVFIAVVTGIVGIGNSSALGEYNKALFKGMGLVYLIAAVAYSILLAIFYRIGLHGGAGGENVLQQLVQLVLDIIPDNLVGCFAADNDLQVIVLSIFTGLALLALGVKAEPINKALDAVGNLVNKMMEFACKLLPAIVFLGVLNMLTTDFTGLASIYKVIVTWLLSVTVIIVCMWMRVRKATGISPFKLFKKQSKALMILLTTSSQVASLPEAMRAEKEDFGVDSKLVDFAMPLCAVIYMPCGSVFFASVIVGIGAISGIQFSLLMLFKVAVVSTIVAIAAPPIPGSVFAVMPILFSACGVPTDDYPLAIILGTVMGYFLPLLNGYILQLETLIAGCKLNLVDRDKLFS